MSEHEHTHRQITAISHDEVTAATETRRCMSCTWQRGSELVTGTCTIEAHFVHCSSMYTVSPNIGRMGRLTAWPGGLVGPPSRWTATSQMKYVKRLTPLTWQGIDGG